MRASMLAVLAAALVSSCTFFPPPVANATHFPTRTPEAFQLHTGATPVPVELSAGSTTSAVLFRDDFNLALADGWEWRGSDPHNISLIAQRGALMLNAARGYASDPGLSSLLLRQAPEGDFQLETRLVFTPTSEPQFAGLVVFETRNAYLQAGRGYCRGGSQCVGRGLYFDRFIDARLQGKGISIPNNDSDAVFLRLERRGTTYSLFASANDVVWQPLGELDTELTPAYVGIFAGQNTQAVIPAYFDYFQINSLPAEPPTQ